MEQACVWGRCVGYVHVEAVVESSMANGRERLRRTGSRGRSEKRMKKDRYTRQRIQQET